MHQRVIVLKLGGSVLESPDSLPRAVHEIYRWRRNGYAVVAVVSAFAGETDRLWSQARAFGARDASTAALAATGELQSAALLGAALDRAGIPACVLIPAALGWIAEGPLLEAQPQSVNLERLREALRREGVVVVPGFSATDHTGISVLLGRGGSDLSALFLAQQLGARCRLLKDVDGLWEWDPQRSGPAPRRYAQASWADALATDGQILQHRAVRWAQSKDFEFELAALGARASTRVGGSYLSWAPPIPATRALRVVLLGLGTVGSGVWQHLRALHPQIEVVAVASRHRAQASAWGVSPACWHADPFAALQVEADVVIELLGGLEPARTLIERALSLGRSVVTANKLVLAEHGQALEALALHNGVDLCGSACVGGSTPVLERVRIWRTQVRSLRGVLSGSVNLILELVAQGATLAEALAEAQARGLTESDAARDLDGRDAADKLRVIARALGQGQLCVDREELDERVVSWVRNARQSGRRLRQIARWESGKARVGFEELEAADPLFELPDAANAVLLEGADAPLELLRGCGAGTWPTAESVLGDLLTLQRARRYAHESPQPLAS